MTAEDYFTFEFASDPRISPDGSQVAYVVSRVDRATNRRVPSVWIARTDGSTPARQLVGENWSPGSPRWLPDGTTLSFIAGRVADEGGGAAGRAPARPQLRVIAAAGGNARRMPAVVSGVSNCSWASDGLRAACVSRTGPSDRWPEGVERSDTRHYVEMGYKTNDAGWNDDKKSHVWVLDARSATATQITEGDGWNDADPQWSPDGRRIAFVSNRTGKENALDRNSDVWVVSAEGGPLTKISTSSGPDNSPRWSPDGRSIAYVGAASDEDPPALLLAPAGGGPAANLAPGLDMLPTDLQWGDGGRALYFGSGVKGETHVFRLDVATKRVAPMTSGPRAVRSVNVAASAPALTYLANDFKRLDDVHAAPSSGAGERKLSSLNSTQWAQLDLAGVERFTYKSGDGLDIDAFVVRPVGFQPNRKYPLVVSIHGGPAGMYGVDWFHEFQVYAAKGYAVFFPNPRGSTGYGRKFQRAIKNEWGGKDYVDVMTGVSATLARNPWIDSTRMGVTGGSYGGYMTNWIAGHTDRFKAIVTLRGITNFLSDDGTRDGAYGHADDFDGDIFQRHDFYWERSPLKYVQNVKTPILILHQDNDYRVPIEQAEQWFRALRHFGKTAEIVFFPRENHNMTRTGEPKHLVESLNWQLYWFDRYVENKPGLVPPNQRIPAVP